MNLKQTPPCHKGDTCTTCNSSAWNLKQTPPCHNGDTCTTCNSSPSKQTPRSHTHKINIHTCATGNLLLSIQFQSNPTSSSDRVRHVRSHITHRTDKRRADKQDAYKSLQSESYNHPLRVITLKAKSVRSCATCRPPPAVRTTSDQRPVRWLVLGYRSTSSSSLPLSSRHPYL